MPSYISYTESKTEPSIYTKNPQKRESMKEKKKMKKETQTQKNKRNITKEIHSEHKWQTSTPQITPLGSAASRHGITHLTQTVDSISTETLKHCQGQTDVTKTVKATVNTAWGDKLRKQTV